MDAAFELVYGAYGFDGGMFIGEEAEVEGGLEGGGEGGSWGGGGAVDSFCFGVDGEGVDGGWDGGFAPEDVFDVGGGCVGGAVGVRALVFWREVPVGVVDCEWGEEGGAAEGELGNGV